jgi:hypothetical protein
VEDRGAAPPEELDLLVRATVRGDADRESGERKRGHRLRLAS